MKILFITDSDKASGGVKQLYYNIRGLAGRGHTIYLAAKPNADVRGFTEGLCAETLVIDFKNLKSDGEKIARYANDLKIDTVHAFHNKGHKVAVGAKRRGLAAKLWVNRGVIHPPGNLLNYWHRGIDGYTCNSHAVADVLASRLIGRKRLNVIYNAYVGDEDRFHSEAQPYPKREGCRIVCVGSESKWKGVDIALAAFNRLTDLDAVMYIVGVQEADFVQHLSPEAKQKAIFLGQRKDVPALLKQMDFLVLAPRTGDSCPNVVLEAFDAGLPVLGTRVGGIGELVAEGVHGHVVPPGRPDALADRMRMLALDPALRGEMSQRNRERIKRFSLDRKTDALERLYQGQRIVQSLDESESAL